MIQETISLHAIVGLSPFNPRQDMESDVSELAATIRAQGLTDPLVVRVADADAATFEVLAGGRRWRALKSIEAREVDVRIFEGSEVEARELALALAVTHKPHHPVEEYEAFAALERAGMSQERIARDFGLTERHVRQRLALGKLAPRLREMWRAGEIDADVARAWATGSVAAQEALLEEFTREKREHSIKAEWEVRRRLRGEALAPNSAIANFLNAAPDHLQAYTAAGGRIEQELWDEGARICDGPIASKLVNDLLRAEAQRVADAEGWGYAFAEDEGDDDVREIEYEHTRRKRRGSRSSAHCSHRRPTQKRPARLMTNMTQSIWRRSCAHGRSICAHSMACAPSWPMTAHFP